MCIRDSYLQFSDHRLGIVIADVAGKGIPAALLMAGLQGSVRSLAGPAVEPGEVNRLLHGMLYRSTTPTGGSCPTATRDTSRRCSSGGTERWRTSAPTGSPSACSRRRAAPGRS